MVGANSAHYRVVIDDFLVELWGCYFLLKRVEAQFAELIRAPPEALALVCAHKHVIAASSHMADAGSHLHLGLQLDVDADQRRDRYGQVLLSDACQNFARCLRYIVEFVGRLLIRLLRALFYLLE